MDSKFSGPTSVALLSSINSTMVSHCKEFVLFDLIFEKISIHFSALISLLFPCVNYQTVIISAYIASSNIPQNFLSDSITTTEQILNYKTISSMNAVATGCEVN